MAEPFDERPRGGFFERILGTSGRRGAIQEIEHLLARAGRVSAVSRGEVDAIAARHGVDLERKLRTPRQHLYRRFFEHCLNDNRLSESESRDLSHLRALLHLDDASARRVHDEVSKRVYGAAIDEVLDDQKLDPEEEAFLGRLRGELEIPEPVAETLLAEGIQRARQRFFSKSAARSSVFLTSQEAPLQLVGASEHSIEGAVHDALDEACRAVPRLHWIELSGIRGEVVEGRVREWQVELKAWLDPED